MPPVESGFLPDCMTKSTQRLPGDAGGLREGRASGGVDFADRDWTSPDRSPILTTELLPDKSSIYRRRLWLSRKTSSANRTAILIIVVIILAIGGGFLGASLKGGGGSAAAASGEQGAFLKAIQKARRTARPGSLSPRR